MVGNRRAVRPPRHLVPRAPREVEAAHHGPVPKALTVANGRRPVEVAQVPKEVPLAAPAAVASPRHRVEATRLPRADTISGSLTTVEQSTNLQAPSQVPRATAAAAMVTNSHGHLAQAPRVPMASHHPKFNGVRVDLRHVSSTSSHNRLRLITTTDNNNN